MRLKVCHLYPDLLNLYGDQGNVLIICQRARWRGIDVSLEMISLDQTPDFREFDIIFLGGGADFEQGLVSRDLKHKGPGLIEAVDAGVVLLAICGGYQLLGQYYQTQDGSRLPGVGLFDLFTIAGSERLRGNILLDIEPGLRPELAQTSDSSRISLVGFENHSGQTFLGKHSRPLGRVIRGRGNNGQDQTEGINHLNAFGTYLHGPFLAKNPHFVDLMLHQALCRRNGEFILPPLEDDLEFMAHDIMRQRILKRQTI